MGVVRTEVYSKDIPLPNFTAEQLLAIAQHAVRRQALTITAVHPEAIECYYTTDGYSGDVIKVGIHPQHISIQSRPINEYYCNEEQSRRNTATLEQYIIDAATQLRLAERNLHPMHREKYGALLLSKTYKITPLLVYANVLVFLVMTLSGVSFLHPTAQGLYAWGGNHAPSVLGGQWWRLITYMFVHAGGMHILMNTFALLYIGMFLEPLMGRWRFLSAYLLTGIGAGLMSIAMHPFSVGVGASGAIFGMYGVFLALLTTSYIKKSLRRTMLRSILFFVTLNLLYGLQGNTDNAAHVGGLLSGIIVGFAMYPAIKKSNAV